MIDTRRIGCVLGGTFCIVGALATPIAERIWNAGTGGGLPWLFSIGTSFCFAPAAPIGWFLLAISVARRRQWFVGCFVMAASALTPFWRDEAQGCMSLTSYTFAPLQASVSLLVGVIWLNIGIGFLFLDERKRRLGRCVKCGYNLFGLSEQRCPECGTVFDPSLFKERI